MRAEAPDSDFANPPDGPAWVTGEEFAPTALRLQLQQHLGQAVDELQQQTQALGFDRVPQTLALAWLQGDRWHQDAQYDQDRDGLQAEGEEASGHHALTAP